MASMNPEDFFRDHNGESNIIRGVNIASKEDQHFLGMVKFSRVDIPANHPIFNMKPTSISGYMKLPLLVSKHGNSPMEWLRQQDKLGFNPLQNRTALFLNFEADPRSNKWGFTDLREWDRDIGSVVVVRQDKKDITPQQVEALCHFCQHELRGPMERLEESLGVGDDYGDEGGLPNTQVREREKFVKENMCQEKFEEFFRKFKRDKLAAEDGSWERAVSPYTYIPTAAEIGLGATLPKEMFT